MSTSPSILCVVTVPTEDEERRLHDMTCDCGGVAFISDPLRSTSNDSNISSDASANCTRFDAATAEQLYTCQSKLNARQNKSVSDTTAKAQVISNRRHVTVVDKVNASYSYSTVHHVHDERQTAGYNLNTNKGIYRANGQTDPSTATRNRVTVNTHTTHNNMHTIDIESTGGEQQHQHQHERQRPGPVPVPEPEPEPSRSKRSWEKLRELIGMSSIGIGSRRKEHLQRRASIELDITPCASLECVLREIMRRLELQGVFWTKDVDQRMLQARFTITLNDKYERLIATLHEWGIGERVGTSIEALNCLDTKSCSYPYNVRHEGMESAWDRFMDSVRCRLNVNNVVRQVRQDATVTFDFLVLLFSAAILACFGLVENSELFLSSSMLISPLMGPIIAGVFGTVIHDRKLWWLGLKNELFGIASVAIVGLVFGIIMCFAGKYFVISDGLTEEILSRCDTHSMFVGLFTALASGAAGAIGVLGDNTGSLIGVAISASLLPPAVNSGLLWALAFGIPLFTEDTNILQNLVKDKIYSPNQSIELIVYASISMALTALNIACVWLMGVLVLRVKEIAPSIRLNYENFWRHDIKMARQSGYDSETQNAIDDYEAQRIRQAGILNNINDSHYQNTWSPTTKTDEYDQMCRTRNYHTVHGFEEFCAALHKQKGLSFTPEPKSCTPSITVMDFFAQGPITVSQSVSFNYSDVDNTKTDAGTDNTITPHDSSECIEKDLNAAICEQSVIQSQSQSQSQEEQQQQQQQKPIQTEVPILSTVSATTTTTATTTAAATGATLSINKLLNRKFIVSPSVEKLCVRRCQSRTSIIDEKPKMSTTSLTAISTQAMQLSHAFQMPATGKIAHQSESKKEKGEKGDEKGDKKGEKDEDKNDFDESVYPSTSNQAQATLLHNMAQLPSTTTTTTTKSTDNAKTLQLSRDNNNNNNKKKDKKKQLKSDYFSSKEAPSSSSPSTPSSPSSSMSDEYEV